MNTEDTLESLLAEYDSLPDRFFSSDGLVLLADRVAKADYKHLFAYFTDDTNGPIAKSTELAAKLLSEHWKVRYSDDFPNCDDGSNSIDSLSKRWQAYLKSLARLAEVHEPSHDHSDDKPEELVKSTQRRAEVAKILKNSKKQLRLLFNDARRALKCCATYASPGSSGTFTDEPESLALSRERCGAAGPEPSANTEFCKRWIKKCWNPSLGRVRAVLGGNWLVDPSFKHPAAQLLYPSYKKLFEAPRPQSLTSQLIQEVAAVREKLGPNRYELSSFFVEIDQIIGDRLQNRHPIEYQCNPLPDGIRSHKVLFALFKARNWILEENAVREFISDPRSKIEQQIKLFYSEIVKEFPAIRGYLGSHTGNKSPKQLYLRERKDSPSHRADKF